MELPGAIALLANTGCFPLCSRFSGRDINLRVPRVCSPKHMTGNVDGYPLLSRLRGTGRSSPV
jgi:hypothetical protein